MQWQEHSLWDEYLKKQMLVEPHTEESTAGQGIRPQLCLSEMLINVQGALLSLIIATGPSTMIVKCLYWKNVLVNQRKDESTAQVLTSSYSYWHPIQIWLPE